jgi:hypothetical protein
MTSICSLLLTSANLTNANDYAWAIAVGFVSRINVIYRTAAAWIRRKLCNVCR